MFGLTYETVFTFFVRSLILFTAMPVHECAHALIADRLGDNTPREQGRLTLNPLAHLDRAGTLILLFTGFGWARPVEVDMRNFGNPRRDMAITSLAGPMSNILMAGVVLVFYKLLLGFVMPAMRYSSWLNILVTLLGAMILINVKLAVFNLLPVPPLDGSKIFGLLLPQKAYWWMMRNQGKIFIAMALLLMFGFLDIPISFLSGYVLLALDFLTSPLDLLFR